ncbi:MAG: T9SS type A sorting domain-containing protein [Flavobacteriales bacterium]|nr:T9SS type A sorting domain-containing protein [Flavobacteriales bacterium]
MNIRHLTPLVALFLIANSVAGQGGAKASACFFSADLEDGLFPAGWTNQQVERLDANGAGTGAFVDAWTVGAASNANAGGFFPVANVPTGNHFIMANDDASPCNCAMDDVALTTPTIDLDGRTGVALQLRAFHEQTLGAGAAIIEAYNGTEWTSLLEIPAVVGEWQHLFVDLSAYDGNPAFQLRFRWSDGGNWASGLAIDDLCLIERLPVDLSVIQVLTHDPSVGPFNTAVRSLRYRQLPATQASELEGAVEVMNRGIQPIAAFDLLVTMEQNGDQSTAIATVTEALAPGERRMISLPAMTMAPNAGTVTLSVQATPSTADDDPTDNTGTALLQLTGDGWEQGYGAMACDDGTYDGMLGGAGQWVAVQRMEVTAPGSTAYGISAVITGSSQEGEQVRAILFDDQLAFVDTSARYTLTAADLDMGAAGEALFLALSTSPMLSTGDYYVGIQHLEGSTAGEVHVATGGNGPLGAAALLTGSTFVVNYTRQTPMVRLHLSGFGVGINETSNAGANDLLVFPVPVKDQATVVFDLAQSGPVSFELLDLSGRALLTEERGYLPQGQHRTELNTSNVLPGTYVLCIRTVSHILTRTIVVSR